MQLLRKYQLDIIFLFFSISALVWTIFFFIQFGGADPHDYEWVISAPLLFFYFIILWRIREKISQHDHRALTGRTTLYWVALGLIFFLSYASPVPASSYLSFEIIFIVFTIFLADSYWDFQKMTIKNIFRK